MKKITASLMCFILGLFFMGCLLMTAGCGKEEKNQMEKAVGNWRQMRNRAYILLITNPRGEWNSSVRIADATSKIVQSKGSAKGTWYVDKGQIIFTVTESDIDQIWKQNDTVFFDILELTETLMRLKDENGRVLVWEQTAARQAAAVEKDLDQSIPMGPIAVNLNKNRSNDKDRYLCMDLDLVLNELMPGQELPPIHPKAREAAVIFLSSLVFNDVKDYDSIKAQNKKLVDVLNPYMQGFIKDIKVNHVIVPTDIDKVEEFIIEHTYSEKPPAAEGEGGEQTGEEEKKQE